MKINLEFNNNPLNGYVNISSKSIDVAKTTENAQIVPGVYFNLDPIIKDESVEEIIFNPPLNLLDPMKTIEILLHWHKKLRKNGVLKIFFVDIKQLAANIHQGLLPLVDIHHLIFGSQNEYKSILDISSFREAMKVCKFQIEFISPKDNIVFVEAIKL